MTLILYGREVKKEAEKRLKEKVGTFQMPPLLVIFQIGDDERSSAYIEQKKKFGEAIGARVEHVKIPDTAEEGEVIKEIEKCNKEKDVSGIIVQLPLPQPMSRENIINSIDPQKDVDGLTEVNWQKLLKGDVDAIVPGTARGVISLLSFYNIDISGKKAAVLGRSRLVGAPTAELLKRKGAEVTVCHSQTPNTKEIVRQSDIVVVAIGKPRFITADYVRTGQVVVDVGINVVTEKGVAKLEEEIPRKKLVGDVDFESVKDIVSAISPVPGGVGPMTVVSLFENLLDVAKNN